METSCLKNKNVADAFETLIEITHREKIKDKKEPSENIKITNNLTSKHLNKPLRKKSKGLTVFMTRSPNLMNNINNQLFGRTSSFSEESFNNKFRK